MVAGPPPGMMPPGAHAMMGANPAAGGMMPNPGMMMGQPQVRPMGMMPQQNMGMRMQTPMMPGAPGMMNP